MDENETIDAFRDITDRLRADTGASRTTIRVDSARLGLDVETVKATLAVRPIHDMKPRASRFVRRSGEGDVPSTRE